MIPITNNTCLCCTIHNDDLQPITCVQRTISIQINKRDTKLSVLSQKMNNPTISPQKQPYCCYTDNTVSKKSLGGTAAHKLS